MSQQREFNGVPSTTQLLIGTREAFLQLTTKYAVNPQNRIYALLGTSVHASLETVECGESEQRLELNGVSGTFDNYEDETLLDNKTYASFKVAQILGYRTRWIFDGFKDGKKQYHKEFSKDGVHHRLDLAIQLNNYRIMAEADNKVVKNMIAELIIRDARTVSALENGIDCYAVLVKINRISDRWIMRYMQTKKERLLQALHTKTLPPPCSHRECWGGKKCEKVCEVWESCPQGIEIRTGGLKKWKKRKS